MHDIFQRMSYDLRNELELDAEKAWGHLTEQVRNNAIGQLETLCGRSGIQWGTGDQRKAMITWRFSNLQIAANKVYKRNQAKGNIRYSILNPWLILSAEVTALSTHRAASNSQSSNPAGPITGLRFDPVRDL